MRPRDEQRTSRLLRQLARAAEGPEGIAPRSRAAVHPVLYFVEGVSRLGRDLVRIDRELDGLRGMGMGMGKCMSMGMGTCMCMFMYVHVHGMCVACACA